MSEALTGSINVRLFLTLTNALDNSVPRDELDKKYQWSVENGNGANQANRLWHDTRSISANSSEELDLVGVLLDAFGATFSPASIKSICVIADSANSHKITMGGSTSATFLAGFGASTHTWDIHPGGLQLVTNPSAGWACANGSTDKLKFANGSTGNNASYFIGLVAAST